MESLPCKGYKGMCCGPVPIIEDELKKIKKKIRAIPKKHAWILKTNDVILGPVFSMTK